MVRRLDAVIYRGAIFAGSLSFFIIKIVDKKGWMKQQRKNKQPKLPRAQTTVYSVVQDVPSLALFPGKSHCCQDIGTG